MLVSKDPDTGSHCNRALQGLPPLIPRATMSSGEDKRDLWTARDRVNRLIFRADKGDKRGRAGVAAIIQ